MKKPVLICSLLLLLGSCVHVAKTLTVHDVVSEIVKRAAANDMAYFAEYLDTPYKKLGPQLIQQIKASGMANNYQSHLEISDTTARLNYHYLEKGCHFQIDLVRRESGWTIERIWFCR